jgi:sRNA-binding regulator protein Hfq
VVERVCYLIDLYHEKQILWDQTQPEYKNKFKKNEKQILWDQTQPEYKNKFKKNDASCEIHILSKTNLQAKMFSKYVALV